MAGAVRFPLGRFVGVGGFPWAAVLNLGDGRRARFAGIGRLPQAAVLNLGFGCFARIGGYAGVPLFAGTARQPDKRKQSQRRDVGRPAASTTSV